jgi:hypothetical protein
MRRQEYYQVLHKLDVWTLDFEILRKGAHKIIRAIRPILRFLLESLMEILMEYFTQQNHQFHLN